MFCDNITGKFATSHSMCPEHTVAYLMDQMKFPLEKAVEYVKSKTAGDPNYFVPNTSGAKATDTLVYPEKKTVA